MFIPRIKQYMVEHIQNLNKILANLKQAGVTIARAKSQFCWAGIRIVNNVNDHHLNILKVFKILD